MAKLRKTKPEDLLNLQNGDFAHFVEDGIAVNDVKTFEPRHHVSKIHKTRNIRTFRLALNAVLSLAVFAAALISGFYPISLLLFLAMYDLRSIKRLKLPLNLSNFIPYKNIEEVLMEKGRLGFNYALIYIKDDNGKRSVKKLKLYDSQSGWDRAVVLFKKIGKLNDREIPAKDLSNLPRIQVGNGIEYVVEGDQLLLLENGKFKPEREDQFKYFRFVAIIGFIAVLSAAAAKVYMIVTEYQYEIVDYVVVAFFLVMSLVPLSFTRKTRPTYIQKGDILGYKESSGKFLLNIKGWQGFVLKAQFSKKYCLPEEVKKLKTFIEG